MKAVDISGLPILPVPKEKVPDDHCDGCKTGTARWIIDDKYSCSRCFLYLILADQQQEVEALISQVEESIRNRLRRDEEGKLIPDDADRIAVGIVTADRFQRARKRDVR